MRQPVWLPHFLEERCDHAPYLSLFGRVMPTYGVLGMAGLGFGLLAALLRCKRFGLSRDDCAYLYILGAVGALVGAKLLYLLPLLPRLAVELPLLWEEPGEFYARYLSGGMVVLSAAFSAVWRRPGGGQIFKAPPVRLLPGAGARPASGARRGAGRLFLRRLLLWTGGSAPWA